MFSTHSKKHEAVFSLKITKNDTENRKKQITARELCPLFGGGAVSIITQRFYNSMF